MRTATAFSGAVGLPNRPEPGTMGLMRDLQKNNVRVLGRGPRTMVLAHGFGCDQTMWRHLVPAFQDQFRLVLFDYVGHGQADASAFDRARYADLAGYAEDVLEICQALAIHDAVFVGHSVSAMIGILAARKDPSRFGTLVLIGPSPRYVDDGEYKGGFTQEDIDGLLDFLDSNFLGWSSTLAPMMMGNADRPFLSEELANSFCRTDPEIAKHFARVTFLSDNRTDLASVTVPTLILQCSQDAIAPDRVGRYVEAHIPGSTFVQLRATGHCPHLSHPVETIGAIQSFLAAHTSLRDSAR
jgi:sigma-B regulation protein RsbQ